MESRVARRIVVAIAAVLGLLAREGASTTVAKRKRKKPPSTVWAGVGGGAQRVIFRSKGAESVTRLGVGSDAVLFSRDVSRCAYTATLFSTPGYVVAFPRDLAPTQVRVETYLTNGAPSDFDYHLVVNC